MFAFNEDEIKACFLEFFHERITHLAAAGSVVNGRSDKSSDLDLLLVLDTRMENDVAKCRQIVQTLSTYTIDLSLKYLDELPTKPEHFQDGPRTPLSLAYISSARFIIGTNEVFSTLLAKLSTYEFQRSVLHAVGEYVMRMESAYFTSSESDLPIVQHQCFKYMTRIIIDVQLFFSPSDMGPYKQLTRPEMLKLGKSDKRISTFLEGVSDSSSPETLITSMNAMHRYLVENLE